MSIDLLTAEGVLEQSTKGFGFLRNPRRNYVANPADPYVSNQLIHKFGLREGMFLAGPIEPGRRGAGPPADPEPRAAASPSCRSGNPL